MLVEDDSVVQHFDDHFEEEQWREEEVEIPRMKNKISMARVHSKIMSLA